LDSSADSGLQPAGHDSPAQINYLSQETSMITTNTDNRFRGLIAAALIGVFFSSLVALPASADGIEPPHVTVKYGDLDISRSQGANALYGRLHMAAEIVCTTIVGSDLSARMHLDACVNKAVADAVTEVNQPALLAIYNAKTAKAQPIRVASRQSP
jgi:UrcA family protein